MTDFSTLVAKRWGIPQHVAAEVCAHFEKGDAFFYLIDYHPQISAHVDILSLGAIYDFLQSVADLAPKKKRVANALQKAGTLTETAQNRIRLCTSSSELDDMLLPYRPNPRSRAQIAANKGLGPLADLVQKQEIEDRSLDDIAQEYVGKDATLASTADVIAGLKDILVERFAYDETVRSMVREFGYDDGFLEVLPRDKKDREFIAYRGKLVAVKELSPQEYLTLLAAEEKKQLRLKYGVQLFRITEVLRHHFIVNPSSCGFDCICEAIDECWTRLLQPEVTDAVKETLRRQAEDWVVQKIGEDLDKRASARAAGGTTLAVGLSSSHDCVIVAIGAEGNLLGATREKHGDLAGGVSARLRQFCGRYRPRRIVADDTEQFPRAEEIIGATLSRTDDQPEILKHRMTAQQKVLADSPWMQKECADLDVDMKIAFAVGLACLQPLSIIPVIGADFFEIHPFQKYVSAQRLSALLKQKIAEDVLHKGVAFLEVADSVLKNLPCVSETVLADIRKFGARDKYAEKNDLLRVPHMTEVVFRNIAGYVYFPNGSGPLDRTLVHPDHYRWVEELAAALNVSVDTLIGDPEQIRGLQFDDPAEKIFIERKLMDQLRFGQQFLSASASRPHRRLSLAELTDGAIVSGRVTNVTPFGAFVDINAACDGLVHISQLADGYVETADQVVQVGDQIDVRVIAIDLKKKRISLSMKNLGERGPKVRPSKNQLSTLADHFKNR